MCKERKFYDEHVKFLFKTIQDLEKTIADLQKELEKWKHSSMCTCEMCTRIHAHAALEYMRNWRTRR